MIDTMTKGTVRLRVPELLAARGWTITEFAERSGLAYNTASALARGYYSRIGFDIIAKLCEVFSVTPGQLFSYTTEEDPDPNK